MIFDRWDLIMMGMLVVNIALFIIQFVVIATYWRRGK